MKNRRSEFNPDAPPSNAGVSPIIMPIVPRCDACGGEVTESATHNKSECWIENWSGDEVVVCRLQPSGKLLWCPMPNEGEQCQGWSPFNESGGGGNDELPGPLAHSHEWAAKQAAITRLLRMARSIERNRDESPRPRRAGAQHNHSEGP